MKLIPNLPRLGAALFLTSFALMLWPSLFIFVLAALAGLAVGLCSLYAVIESRDGLRISWALATALLLAYDGGSVSTAISAGSTAEFAILTKERPVELISSALALVNIVCGLMLMAGAFERPASVAINETTKSSTFSIGLTVIGTLSILTAFVAGSLGYMGVQSDELGRVTALGIIGIIVEGPLAGIAGYMVARGQRRLHRVFYALTVALITLAVVPTGRRAIILILLVTALGFALGGGLRRLSFTRKLIGVLLGGTVAYVAGSYFFALRLAGWELGNNVPFGDQLWLGLEFMVSPALQERFTTLFYDNIRERTFVLGYFSDLLEAVEKSAPLHGEALLYYLRLAVPSVLDPGKDQILAYQMVETLVHPKLGLPVIDQANTILTDGITDFGIAGVVAYPFGIIALMRGSIWLMQKLASPVTVMFGTFAVVHLTLKPEITMDEYFVLLRSLAMILPVLWAAETMLGYNRQQKRTEGRLSSRP